MPKQDVNLGGIQSNSKAWARGKEKFEKNFYCLINKDLCAEAKACSGEISIQKRKSL
jgi:hypothetical protein